MNMKLVAAVISNALIVILFVQALLNPEDNIKFIYGYGIFIFVSEFLSLHSSVMLKGAKKTKATYFLLAVYGLFALSFSVALNTFYPALIFMLSLVAKVLVPNDSEPNIRPGMQMDKFFSVQFITFLMSGLAIPIIGIIAAILFPFPASVYAEKPANTSGLFVDMPQSLLAWGILYYSIITIWAASFLKKSFRSATK